jgi:hypothetical protein
MKDHSYSVIVNNCVSVRALSECKRVRVIESVIGFGIKLYPLSYLSLFS